MLVMEVKARLESNKAQAGEPCVFNITFEPNTELEFDGPPTLILGFAVVQGFFKLGDMIVSEPFEGTKTSGVVINQHGFEYSTNSKSGNLFSNMLNGFKQLVVERPGHLPPLDDSQDYPIFFTNQLLLFTELELKEPKTFRFQVDFPSNLPSSYKSKSLTIGYNLVLGFQRPMFKQKPIETKLFLPFKLQALIPSPRIPNLPIYDLRYPTNAPSPRLLDQETQAKFDLRGYINKISNASPADASVDEIEANFPGSHFTKVHFELSKSGVPIAHLNLAKPFVKIGDILTAQVKFFRPCLHLSAYVELREEIFEPYTALKPESGEQTSSNVYTCFSRQFVHSLGLKELGLYFPTLTSATSRLDTEQLRASWTLKLEFVGLAGAAFAENDDLPDIECLEAIGQVDYEVFTCRIPLQILPSDLPNPASKTWKF